MTTSGATSPRYDVIEVRPLTRRIGAEIFGVDLAEPLSEQAHEEVHDALMAHQVVFFRDQHLNHERLKALGRQFGELTVHAAVDGLAEHPEIVRIHADADSRFIAGEEWHSDLTCAEEPPMGSILYLEVVPAEAGGDTMFASMYAAYDALSDHMKGYLDGLTALHDAEHLFRELFPDVERKYPRAVHPVVRTHPVTGRKGLYVNPYFTLRIMETGKAESEAILRFLYGHCADPNFHARFRWRPGSVAFWDNRCTQHLAVWDYRPETRTGYRVQIAGDKPF